MSEIKAKKLATDAAEPGVAAATGAAKIGRVWGFQATIFLRLAGGLAALAVIVGGVVWYQQHYATTKVCSDSLIRSASIAINDVNRDALATYQTQILAAKSYQRDPNCLYILMRTAMVNNDTASSRLYYNNLKKHGWRGFSPVFETQVYSQSRANQIINDMADRDKIEQQQENALEAQLNKMDQAADKQLQEQKQ